MVESAQGLASSLFSGAPRGMRGMAWQGGAAPAAGGAEPARSAALVAPSCAAAGAALMTEDECKAATARRGFGRRYLGTTEDAKEAAGCVLWEENGNVEFNTKTAQPQCNVRGTCLCKKPDGTEVQVIGTPPKGA